MVELIAWLIAYVIFIAILALPIVLLLLLCRHIIKAKDSNKRKDPTTFNGTRNWYPTGWTFNEKTQLWEPPDYLKKESNNKWKWDPNKEIWIDQEKEARRERYRKYHEGQPPSFEEWKTNKQTEAGNRFYTAKYSNRVGDISF